MRQATNDYAAGRFNQEACQTLARKLKLTDVAAFVTLYRAGVCMNFRYAGQCVPNRQDIMDTVGARTFIDLAGGSQGVDMYRAFINERCVPEIASILAPLITVESMRVHTAGHEFNHPACRSIEIDKALGKQIMLLEEAKATALGLLVAEFWKSTPEHRLELVAAMVARAIRMAQKTILKDETFAGYAREGMMLTTTLFNSGVMALTENGITVDLQKAVSGVWFGKLSDFIDLVTQDYWSHDSVALARLEETTKTFCDPESAQLAPFIAWVNK